jgi:hypothetical protein
MSIYELELSPAAKRDLKELPVNIQREVIFKHLPIIKETPFSLEDRSLESYTKSDPIILGDDLSIESFILLRKTSLQ